ncbi:hypothetical protein STEG23_030185 [Scotinomys teguina]
MCGHFSHERRICMCDLGDCWLLAAIASLTLNEKLLYRVVPRDQSFQKNYAGIFHFQFWQYGEWVEVVIDDRLPTKNGQLLFLHSEEGSEFWSALLEKAYAKPKDKILGQNECLSDDDDDDGDDEEEEEEEEEEEGRRRKKKEEERRKKEEGRRKKEEGRRKKEEGRRKEVFLATKLNEVSAPSLNGSYEALAGGSTVEGFEDFTGGISEFYDLRKPPGNLYHVIRKALRAGSLLGCSIDVSNAAEAEAITWQKLVKGHAYSVTGVEELDFRGRPEKLIRLRNPWGEVEWSGAWSDAAPEWNYIDPRKKEELDKRAEDGEFWMSFSDFLKQFSRLEICNLSPDSLSSEEAHKWNLVLFNGRWTRGSTAGGCQNYPATYWTNPQFKIHLDEVDEDQEEGTSESCCTVLLGLMQKNRRRRKRIGQGMLSIGYAVYQIPKEVREYHLNRFGLHSLECHTDAHLGRDFFLGHQPSARSSTYMNLREVSSRVRLPPGQYLVVPSTFEPFKDGDFCLRVFSEKKAKAQEMGDAVAGNPHEPHPCDMDGEDEHLRSLFEEFADKEIYQEMDHNHVGTIDAHEMRTALKKAGFTLNNQVQQTIAMRYSSSQFGIDFDGFVACMIRLETLFKLFRLLDKDQNGIVQLSLAEIK